MDTSIYNDLDYFLGSPENPEQNSWENGQIRFGSQCEAIAYSMGYTSFSEVKEVLGFIGDGSACEPILGAKKQLELLSQNIRRYPKGVLEIGGGRGEVSIGLTYLGFNVQMVEACCNVMKLLDLTSRKFGMCWPAVVIDKSIREALPIIDWTNIDTVIFVESIEHISPEDFDYAYPMIKETLRRNMGYLIITNWIGFMPIVPAPPWHLKLIDDAFYSQLSKDAEKVIYREGSHLVLQY